MPLSQTRATILAAVAAPFVPAFFGALGTPIARESFNTDIASVLGLTVVFYPFAFVLGNAIGLPLFFILRRQGLVRWWSATAVGALAGAFAAVATRGEIYLPDFPVLMPEGALAGLVFWALWRLGGAQQVAPGDAR